MADHVMFPLLQEVLKKVVPSQCLGFTWSQKNSPSNEHMAPPSMLLSFSSTVWPPASSPLPQGLSVVAQEQAWVVEHWVKVARVWDGLSSEARLWNLGNGLFSFACLLDGSLRSRSLHSPRSVLPGPC